MSTADESPKVPIRREPPPLRRVRVIDRRELSPRMVGLTFEGEDLGQMDPPEPAGSVRLLVPSSGSNDLIIPTWTGNEFLLPDGSRPTLRTFTPLRFDPDAGRLDLEIVRHPAGAISTWAETAGHGSDAAISGPARGLSIDVTLERFILFGDETALPALSQLLEVLPDDISIDVHAEVTIDEARIELPHHPRAEITWHLNDRDAPGARLIDAARAMGEIQAGDHVWAAGEAASMHAIRKYLFDTRGIPRSQATVRGYWKPAKR